MQVEQMMWESGQLKMGTLAGSRQTGQRRSSSFFAIASLRNSTISLLGDAAGCLEKEIVNKPRGTMQSDLISDPILDK